MILSRALLVSLLTFLSRITGYVRDIIIAAHLGAGILNDIFVIAFRLPNLFRSLFAEGALSAAFIPILSKKWREEGSESANKFSSVIKTILTVFITLFSLVMIAFMPQFINFTVLGFNENDKHFELLVFLSRISFTYIIFITLAAFYGGILHVQGRFFAYSFASVILNLCLISASFISSAPYDVLKNLCYAVSIAGVLEYLWMLLFIAKGNIKPKLIRIRYLPEVKTFLKRFWPGVIGSGVTQLNVWLNTIIASISTGGVSYLYFADRIVQLPLALVGTSLSTVLLPFLSADKPTAQTNAQKQALLYSMFIIIPATFGIWFLAYDIVHVLFERGKFSANETLNTAKAIRVIVCALPAFVVAKLLVTRLHSMGDTKTPVKVGIVCMIINVLVGISLIKSIGFIAVAFGMLISAWMQVALLAWYLITSNVSLLQGNDAWQMLKCVIASSFMVLLLNYLQLKGIGPLFHLLLCIVIGMVFYILSCLLFNVLGLRHNIKKLYAKAYK